MNEFKGTKSPWRVEGKFITSHQEDVCEVFCWDSPEEQFLGSTAEGSIIISKANAQLISCAPEMLEMLEKLYNNGFKVAIGESIEIQQLIKKATTI